MSDPSQHHAHGLSSWPGSPNSSNPACPVPQPSNLSPTQASKAIAASISSILPWSLTQLLQALAFSAHGREELVGKQPVFYVEPHKPSSVCVVWRGCCLSSSAFLPCPWRVRCAGLWLPWPTLCRGNERRCWELRNEVQVWLP